MIENFNPATKKCPMCAEEIKTEARICRYCKARFDVTIKGYCCQDHQLVAATAEGKCPLCQGELIDTHVDSKLVGGPAPAPTSIPVGVSSIPTPRPLSIAAPVAGIPAVASTTSVSFWQFYLSPRGRIGRLAFFLKGILPVLGLLGLTFFLMYTMTYSVDVSRSSGSTDILTWIGTMILFVGMLSLCWSLFVLLVKRMHDLGRSGWYILLWLIPLVGQFINLWNWIEFLFVKGIDGPNKYGNRAG